MPKVFNLLSPRTPWRLFYWIVCSAPRIHAVRDRSWMAFCFRLFRWGIQSGKVRLRLRQTVFVDRRLPEILRKTEEREITCK